MEEPYFQHILLTNEIKKMIENEIFVTNLHPYYLIITS